MWWVIPNYSVKGWWYALAPFWVVLLYKCFSVVGGMRQQKYPAQWFLNFAHGCAWMSTAEFWKTYAKSHIWDSHSAGLGWSLGVQSTPCFNQRDFNIQSRLKGIGFTSVVIIRARALDILSGLCRGLELTAWFRTKDAGINSKALILVGQSRNQVINLVATLGK